MRDRRTIHGDFVNSLPPLPARPERGHGTHRKAGISTLVGAGFGLFLLAVGFLSAGIGGALVLGSLLALVTALYTVVSGRRSWAQLAGRKAGSIVLVAGFCALALGSSLLPAGDDAVPTATAEQSRSATPPGTAAATPKPPASAGPTPTTEPAESTAQTPSPAPTPSSSPTPSPIAAVESAPAAPDQPEDTVAARALLDTLPVKGRAPKTGYDREQFGQAWLDVDRNGCDTRNDMLNRDLRDIVHANSVPCKVQAGTLDDPYTGSTIDFVRGQDTSSDVQIDHVVALADAWQKGAQQLTFDQRAAFANDPLNLQATDGATNQQKGAGDAATWLPPNRSFRCEYVATQISVKARYDLWVTQAEHDAMARVLSDCVDVTVPTTPPAASPPVPPPAPVIQPAPPQTAPYPNCSAARADGAAPVHVGQPGYGSHLDGDGDGVGCE